MIDFSAHSVTLRVANHDAGNNNAITIALGPDVLASTITLYGLPEHQFRVLVEAFGDDQTADFDVERLSRTQTSEAA